MTKKSIYFYPSYKGKSTISQNPYMRDLIDSCSSWANIANSKENTKLGILDILINLNKIDTLWFNWIENLPDRRFGILQTIVYLSFIYWNKVIKKTIIYTVHNRVSHSLRYYKVKKIIQSITIRNSSIIISHSTEGIIYINSYRKHNSNIKELYIPHPTKINCNYEIIDDINYKRDILIWGTLYEYKGVKEYLEFVYKNNLQNNYKIKIIGKVANPKYLKILNKYKNDFIEIEDRFVSSDELINLLQTSKIVLFTYNSSSVFSSGSLIESLRYNHNIIGPCKGEFKNLCNLNLIKTYDNYFDLIKKVDALLNEKNELSLKRKIEINKYLTCNTWENLSKIIQRNIDK